MRGQEVTALLLVAIACRSDKPAPPAPTPTPAPVQPAAPLVELLHAVPATVRVSSQVQNAAIKPEHLVDRDLNTAWNSRTGELAGAWIQVALPAGAHVAQIKLTAGHAGHGPKGEDYFTMNPRIRRVSVLHGDQLLGTFGLDPDKRELQTLAVSGEGTLRVRVDSVVLGSKKSWRETCVSELEVWGTLPPGVQAQPLTPVVEVEPVKPASAFDKLCAGLDEATRQYELAVKPMLDSCAKDPSTCPGDGPGPPACHVDIIDISSPAPPWREIALHTDMSDTGSHTGTIELLVRANDEVITADSILVDNVPVDIDNVAAKVERGVLVVDYDALSATRVTHHHVKCTAAAKPTCEAVP